MALLTPFRSLCLAATLLPALPLAGQVQKHAGEAEQAYLAGARLLEKDPGAALGEFTRAASLDSSHREYRLAEQVARSARVSELVRQAATARNQGDAARAEHLLAEAAAVDPTNELTNQRVQPPRVADREPVIQPSTEPMPGAHSPALAFAPPIVLLPSNQPRDLHLRGNTRSVVTEMAGSFQIRPVFDESVDSQTLRLDLDQTTYDEAMPILIKMAHVFTVALDPHQVLVVKDTQENRQRFEPLEQESIFVPGSTTAQLNELQLVIKNVLDVRQVAIAANAGTLLVRAPAATLDVLNHILPDLTDLGADVSLELKLYSVDKSRIRNIGASTPTSAGVYSVASEAQTLVSNNQTLVQQLISSGLYTPTGNTATDTLYEALYLVLSGLVSDSKVTQTIAKLGGGLTTAGLYIGSSASFNFALNSSEFRALDDITVRIRDRETSTLKVGSKYPITTGIYSSGASTSALAGLTINGVSVSSLLSQYTATSSSLSVPQIEYEDLGLTLKTTPTVLKSGAITTHLDLKIEALTGTSLNSLPILSSRNFVSDITIPEGATAMFVSSMSRSESASVSGLPGVGDLPGLDTSVADKTKEVDSSELILLVTPHLARRRSATLASAPIPFHTSAPIDY